MAEAAEPGTLAGTVAAEGGIGTPDGLRAHLAKFEACGVDQVAFIQQGGRNKHEHICEALELFAGEVMGEFKEREAERVRRKNEELAPFVEAALKRKEWIKPLAEDEIPPVLALGRQIARRQPPPGRLARGAGEGEGLSASPVLTGERFSYFAQAFAKATTCLATRSTWAASFGSRKPPASPCRLATSSKSPPGSSPTRPACTSSSRTASASR